MNTLAPGYGLENRDPVTILKDIPTAALRMQKLQHRRDDSGAVLRRVTEERMEIRTDIHSLERRVRERRKRAFQRSPHSTACRDRCCLAGRRT